MPITLSGRILLAEDAAETQRLHTHYLESAGAAVVVVPDGMAAVEAALASRREGAAFPLILMDVDMPRMDGLTAARLLRAAGWLLPIVAITANASEHDQKRCQRAGCDGWLQKPIDRCELVRACAAWMPGKSSGRSWRVSW
jgi:CheY-like chemotaxis protein